MPSIPHSSLRVTARWLAQITCITAIAASLSACGSDAEPTASTAQTQTSSVDTASASDTPVMQPVVSVDAYTPTQFASDSVVIEKERFAIDLANSANLDTLQLTLPAPESSEIAPEASTKRLLPTKTASIGFGRALSARGVSAQNSADLKWKTLSNGRKLAAVEVESQTAKALRLALAIDKMPSQAILRVYAKGAEKFIEIPGHHVNELIQKNISMDGDSIESRTYYTPHVIGSIMILEIELPADIGTDQLRFTLPRVLHGTLSPQQAAIAKPYKDLGDAGSCNLDANCTLPPVANAVTAYQFVGYINPTTNQPVWGTCTATLLADTANTSTPYLLTANHCVQNQTQASTVESLWFYRSSACNSTTVNPSLTGRFGGAQFLFGISDTSPDINTPTGTDTTLLKMNEAPPPGAMFAGWSTVRQNLGTGATYTALHHAKGDMLKRSAGQVTSYSIALPTTIGSSGGQTAWPMYRVNWSSGITEKGSSGSALFLNGTSTNPQVVGQLHGGFSSCTASPATSTSAATGPTEPDFYGRFDVAYEAGLKNWLNPDWNGFYDIVFRFYNDGAGLHFYTNNIQTRDQVIVQFPMYRYERPAFKVRKNTAVGLLPVHRFWHQGNGSHFYTIDEFEKNYIIANYPIYKYEGQLLGNVSPSQIPGSIPLYRFFKPSNNTHFFTASFDEYQSVIANFSSVYTFERVAFYVWPLTAN